MEVGLTYNLKPESGPTDEDPPSSCRDGELEWDDLSTIHAVRDALSQRHRVTLIEANEDAFGKFLQFRSHLDLVFNIAEGTSGVNREAHIPSMLEFLGMRYTASDPLTLSLCLDKARTKEILSYYGIPTANFTVVEPRRGMGNSNGSYYKNGLKYPLIVKPVHEGSSKGIFNDSFIKNESEFHMAVSRIFERYHQGALVEEFLSGREFTVGLIGNGHKTEVLPIVEIKFEELPAGVHPIYSYEAKWIWDQPARPLDIFQCPAEIDEPLRRKIETICLTAYRALRCRDWSRIDVRLDEVGEPHIIEVNPLPGILPGRDDNSCLPKAARAAAISYDQLINRVLDIACERYGLI